MKAKKRRRELGEQPNSRHKRETLENESESEGPVSLRKTNSANTKLGLSVVLNPQPALYSNEFDVPTASDNFVGFRVCILIGMPM